jgi:methionine synthase II (cobalamin-independent)
MAPSRVQLPAGLVTGIGPLPHFDPGDAIEFVLRHSPGLPAGPALPARSRREGMIAQAATGIAGVEVLDDGSLDLHHSRLDPEAPLDASFAGDAHVGLRAFLTAVADRDGPLKVSVTGPVTLGVALHAAGVDADLAFRLSVRAVGERSRALAALVLQRVPQAQLVVFVDEPALGDLTERGFPIGPNEGVDLVSSILAGVEPHGITGLHCCRRTDWRLALGAGPDVLSVPVDAGLAAHAGTVADFVDRGGWIAWGAVPTDGPVGPTAERLWRRLADEIEDLVDGGGDPELLHSRALVTPVCGLAHHGVTQAEQVMALTRGVARHLRRRVEATTTGS